MEGNINNAKQFLNSKEGEGVNQQLFGSGQPSGDPQIEQPSYDAQGNQGQPGQFGQEGQFGAVTGKGFGGGFSSGNQQQASPEKQEKRSDYEEWDPNGDSTQSGGWGTNAQGNSSSRQNQMNADAGNQANPGGVANDNDDDDHNKEGFKTGYSTPGYRKEGETEEDVAKRLNQNVYGQQADDRGAKGNDYNEADI
ncbi:uncharacterized protein L201_006479 [Kwoniella dendrophila CBS 6074]|uniref:Uncharacterized protein n=1 Tax=Kwoniella dendrophila CBS 6074 TaxID=1295534 RepID=A0AAX4K351_9TREE